MRFTTASVSATAPLSRRRRFPTATSPTAFCLIKPSILSTKRPAGFGWAVDSKPEALDEIDRRLVQLKIEREALRKEAIRRPSTGWRNWSSNLRIFRPSPTR